MARDERIDALLREWAQYLDSGDGSGFSTMSVLHQDWTPPGGGVLPTLKVARRSTVWRTHAAVGQLSIRLRNTLVVHYVLKLKLEEQAQRLECAVSTVHQRVIEAHRLLRPVLIGRGGSSSELP